MAVSLWLPDSVRGSRNDDWFQFKVNIIVQNLPLMKNLLKIIQSAEPGNGVQFRKKAYGTDEVRGFLRDVIALANAPVQGARYIVVGVGIDSSGKKEVSTVDESDFSGKPAYPTLVAEYVEPMIKVQYRPVVTKGARLGVFEISDCQDRPYMMRADHSETLRRGDAYVRIENMPVKMGRRQLQGMFEKKFVDSVSAEKIEIGFPGEIIHKDMRIKPIDLGEMPSALASEKLTEMMDIHNNPKNRGSTTVISRMVHARLFGSDDPYEDRTRDELQQELDELQIKHAKEDQHFLFESNIESLQLVILNQGEEPIEDATLKIVMPRHEAFFVAEKLPMQRRGGKFVARTPAEIADYPSVSLKKDSVTVSNIIGDVPPDSPKLAFTIPLRVCVGTALAGRRLAIKYQLDGRNIRKPATGQLRLLF